MLEGDLVTAAAAQKDLTDISMALLAGSKGSYLIKHEGKVSFLFQHYGWWYNLEMPAGSQVIFAQIDMGGDGLATADWADAPELRDNAIFQAVDGGMAPAT